MLGRVLILLAGVLTLIAADRLLNAWWLGPVTGDRRSVGLGIAFVCGGLAPLFLGIGCLFEAFADHAVDAPDDRR
jgi:hypothetical protein